MVKKNESPNEKYGEIIQPRQSELMPTLEQNIRIWLCNLGCINEQGDLDCDYFVSKSPLHVWTRKEYLLLYKLLLLYDRNMDWMQFVDFCQTHGFQNRTKIDIRWQLQNVFGEKYLSRIFVQFAREGELDVWQNIQQYNFTYDDQFIYQDYRAGQWYFWGMRIPNPNIDALIINHNHVIDYRSCDLSFKMQNRVTSQSHICLKVKENPNMPILVKKLTAEPVSVTANTNQTILFYLYIQGKLMVELKQQQHILSKCQYAIFFVRDTDILQLHDFLFVRKWNFKEIGALLMSDQGELDSEIRGLSLCFFIKQGTAVCKSMKQKWNNMWLYEKSGVCERSGWMHSLKNLCLNFAKLLQIKNNNVLFVTGIYIYFLK